MALEPEARRSVLIVDDDEDSLDLSRRLMLEADPALEIVTALGAPQAMTYLLEVSRPARDVPMPTLILLDVNMPGMGGFEVLRWVRQNQALADIKVVMHSTSDSPADIRRATELGAHGYLIKFPSPMVLACVLRQARGKNGAEANGQPEQSNQAGCESAGLHQADALSRATLLVRTPERSA